MIKKKRILMITLLVTLLVFSLFGTVSAGDKKLSLWMFPLSKNTREELTPILESFSRETGIMVDLTLVPWGSGNQKILASIAAGNPPDVMYTTMSRVLPLVEFGDALQPLNNFIEKDLFADPGTLNNYRLEEKIYAAPFLGGIHRWSINEKLFKNSGLDDAISKMTDKNASWNWSDLKAWSKEITKDNNDDGTIDQYGFIYPGGSSSASPFFRLFWNTGGKVLSDDGEVLIGDKKTVQTLTLLKEMTDNNIMPKGSENISPSEVDSLFVEGKVGIHVGPSVQILKHAENGGNIDDFKVVYPPKNYEGPRGSFMAWDALAISKEADAEAAWKLIEHFLQSEKWSEYLLELGLFPVSGAKAESIENKYYKRAINVTNDLLNMEQYAYNKHEILHPKSTQINRVINNAVQNVLINEQSPQEAADYMKEEIKKIIKE